MAEEQVQEQEQEQLSDAPPMEVEQKEGSLLNQKIRQSQLRQNHFPKVFPKSLRVLMT